MHNLERGLNTFRVLQQKPIQNFLQNKSSNIENFLQHHKEDRGQQNPGFVCSMMQRLQYFLTAR